MKYLIFIGLLLLCLIFILWLITVTVTIIFRGCGDDDII